MLQADLNESIDHHLPFLKAFEKKATVANGRYPIVVPQPEQILFSKLKESLQIDRYRSGAALYSSKLGEKVFSDQFSLYDVDWAPELGIASAFDGEGVRRENPRLPLIERRVFKNVISDLRNARKYGTASTGNGQRSFDSNSRLDFNAVLLGRGSRDYRALMKEMGECIFILMAMGGGFTDTGDFSTPVHLSFLVKGGEIIGRLPPISVKSSLAEMFGDRLLAVSSDGLGASAQNPCLFAEMEVINH